MILTTVIPLAVIATMGLAAMASTSPAAQAQVESCYEGTVTVGAAGGASGFWFNNFGSRTPESCTVNGKTVTVHQLMFRGDNFRVVLDGAVDADFPDSVTLTMGAGMVTLSNPSSGTTYLQGQGRDYEVPISDQSLTRSIMTVNNLEPRPTVEALPLSDDPDPFVASFCWRLPGCPLSVIFGAPVIMMATLLSAGQKHPAVLLLGSGGTFMGFLILLDPNPFAFAGIAAVAAAAFMLWRFVR